MKPPPGHGGPQIPGAVGPGEALLAATVAVGIGACGALWATGQVAGLLSSGRWPRVGAADMARVLVELPGNVGDPAQAWPAAARGELPGPVAFYAVMAVLLLALLVLAFGLMRLWAAREGLALPRARGGAGLLGRRPLARRPREHSARWARIADVRRLVVAAPTVGRLMLGRVGRRLVASEERQSVIVVAPTQSLKTTGFAVPALLEWEGPALATSIKTDLVRDSIAHRSEMGEVRVFDPTAVTDLPRSSWTPLAQCDTWEGARRCAFRLIQASQLGRSGQDADFWARAGARYLAPLLFAARRQELTMREVTRWVNSEEEDEVRAALGASDGEVADADDAEGSRAALEVLESVWAAEDRLRSSLLATVAGAIDAYGDSSVLECSQSAEITAEWCSVATTPCTSARRPTSRSASRRCSSR